MYNRKGFANQLDCVHDRKNYLWKNLSKYSVIVRPTHEIVFRKVIILNSSLWKRLSISPRTHTRIYTTKRMYLYTLTYICIVWPLTILSIAFCDLYIPSPFPIHSPFFTYYLRFVLLGFPSVFSPLLSSHGCNLIFHRIDFFPPRVQLSVSSPLLPCRLRPSSRLIFP